MSIESPGNIPAPLPDLSDADLYFRLKANQPEALGILYDRHASLVYGLALRVLGTQQEAEDLTQDIFLNLVRSSFDPKRGSLRTYLATLTRSRAIDRVRSRTTATNVLRKWQPGSGATETPNLPFDFIAQREQAQEVQAALAELSDEQQTILRMAYYDGLSQSQIAERLNIPLGTVKARARRGLLKLRQTLTDYIG
ncbi:sigma-70 family RNA polymerase sigma factor [Leptolyngbya sp. AN02str]|uniref:sigma-70 family RNA polymerase sigma factor n=1 Tax=Leptolyngbya sp. AN02str TaxID=3423363 RepID=UPI003D31F24A